MLCLAWSLSYVPPIVAECTRPARALLPRVPASSLSPLLRLLPGRSAVWTPPEPPPISAILLWAAENAVDPYFIAASGIGFMKQKYVTSKICHIGLPTVEKLVKTTGPLNPSNVPNPWWDRWIHGWIGLYYAIDTYGRWFKFNVFYGIWNVIANFLHWSSYGRDLCEPAREWQPRYLPSPSSPAPHQPRPPARSPGLLLGELNLDHLAAQPAWPLPRQPPNTINYKERFM